MYFNKIDTADNFRYQLKEVNIVTESLGDDVFHFSLISPKWSGTDSQTELFTEELKNGKSNYTLSHTETGLILAHKGETILQTLPDKGFGVCGKKWIINFEYNSKYRFYGLGEKNNGFEKTGIFTKFWNTDAWADFSVSDIRDGVTDPMYASLPYLLIQKDKHWVGVLLNNPYPVFMTLGAKLFISNQQEAESVPEFNVGSTNGQPSIYFIVGSSALDVTRKLQRLIGTTPRPPVWALGHHQCRWGYKSSKELTQLEKKFRQHKIPNDGLWLDIDYMENFKIFTFNKKYFKDPEKEIKSIVSRNNYVVPIIDPGVKLEEGYSIYDEGIAEDYFCKNSEGFPFVGYVWPGKTVFPDFSMETVREWWSDKVAEFAKTGVSGAWLDMNDPAVGRVELNEMLFNNGKKDHESYHNQYALGMSKATHKGFLKANPQKRPFLLTRSAFIGTARFAAVWTGDNCSNFHHLRQAIPITLNLSLSGIPFNGPDVPGFADSPTDELAIKWYKACALFPFLRNHNASPVDQEPWTFREKTNHIIRDYIKLRYKLLPYIYNVFIQQEQFGDPILRPLFYHFESTEETSLEKIDDQFMVGSDIMQAPLLDEGSNERNVTLPKGKWFSVLTNSFIDGDKVIQAVATDETTPIYFKEGAIIPMQPGTRTTNDNSLNDIELHIFITKESQGTYHYNYIHDDGESFSYKNGVESQYSIEVVIENNIPKIIITSLREESGTVSFKPVFYDKFSECILNGKHFKLKRCSVAIPGLKNSFCRSI